MSSELIEILRQCGYEINYSTELNIAKSSLEKRTCIVCKKVIEIYISTKPKPFCSVKCRQIRKWQR